MSVPRMLSINHLQHLFRTYSCVFSPAHARLASYSSQRTRPFVEFTPNIHQRKKSHHFSYIFRWWHLISTSSRPVPLPFWWITSYLYCNGLPIVKVLSIHSAQNYNREGSEIYARYVLSITDPIKLCHLHSLYLSSVSVFYSARLKVIQAALCKVTSTIFLAATCYQTLV